MATNDMRLRVQDPGAIARCSALEAPVPLACVSSFLRVRDLMALRVASRSCYRILPQHTRSLVGTCITRAEAFAVLTAYFPLGTALALYECELSTSNLCAALSESIAPRWGDQLRTLELSRVLSLSDGTIAQFVQQLPALESLTLDRCYMIHSPTLCSARLRHVRIEHSFFTQFGAQTHLPVLTSLAITSQALSTLHVRHLIKQTLRSSGAALETLALVNCSAVSQVLIDPLELPRLTTLDLRACQALERVHVASQSLTALALDQCVALQFVVLDVSRMRALRLAYLKCLSHVFVRAAALETLDMTASSALEPQHVHVACPALQVARLDGTNVTMSDVTRIEQDMVASVAELGLSS